VALLGLIEELDLGHSRMLVVHLRVACTAVAEVLQVYIHLQVGEAGGSSLNTQDFHNENTS